MMDETMEPEDRVTRSAAVAFGTRVLEDGDASDTDRLLVLIEENTRRQAEAFEQIRDDFAKMTQVLGNKVENSPAAKFAIRKLIGG